MRKNKKHQIPHKRGFVEQTHSSAWPWLGLTAESKFSPKSWSSNAKIPTPTGQWIDGPGAKNLVGETNDHQLRSPSPASPIKKCQSSAYLDPLKHEFIKQWVHLQEIEHSCRTPIESTFGNLPTNIRSNFDSAENASIDCYPDVETRDICLQINEEDIDAEAGTFSARFPNSDHHIAGRYLEDIVEVEEEENQSEKKFLRSEGCQSRASVKSIRRSGFQFSGGQGSLKREYEALATLDVNSFFDNLACTNSDLHNFTIPSTSLAQDHPLRILSRECMDTKSDSFSFTTDNLENTSSCETDQLDDDIPTDEELERAMQASLTSIRSHELLAKLKAENFPNNLSRKLIRDDSPPSGHQNLLNLRTFDEASCSKIDVSPLLEKLPENSFSLKVTPFNPRPLAPIQDPMNYNNLSSSPKRPSNLPSLVDGQMSKIGVKESKLKPITVKSNKDVISTSSKNNEKSKATSKNIADSPSKAEKMNKTDRDNQTVIKSPAKSKTILQSVPPGRYPTENLMP
uniref:Uncharacterized protein n=1 Tax=Romanomermis culicivorax TaxID=13658 RepID=A0A915KL90_ROMCU